MSLTFLSTFAPKQKTEMREVLLECATLALKLGKEGAGGDGV